MNRRLRWMTLTSIVLHLVILWFLPRPSFQSPAEREVKSVRLQLEKTESEEKPAEQRSQETTPKKESVSQPATEPAARPENRTGESNEQPEQTEPGPTAVNETEESAPDPSDENDREEPRTTVESNEKTSTEKPDAPDEEPTAEGTHEKTDYGLLQRDNQFQSGGSDSGKASPNQATNQRTQTAVKDTVEPYRVVEPRPSASNTDTRQQIIIQEPGGRTQDTENISVPVMSIAETEAEAPPLQPVAEGSPRETTPRRSDRRVLRNPLPEAPEWLEETGQDVRIILQYVIDPDGNVVDVTVTNSSGFPELDSLVTQKLSRWKFEPGDRSERRLIVFRFNLTQEGN